MSKSNVLASFIGSYLGYVIGLCLCHALGISNLGGLILGFILANIVAVVLLWCQRKVKKAVVAHESDVIEQPQANEEFPQSEYPFYEQGKKIMAQHITALPGGQEDFLNSTADICVYGANSERSIVLLLQALQHTNKKSFYSVIFSPTLSSTWSTSRSLLLRAGGKGNEAEFKWTFPSGASIKLAHLRDPHMWQGSCIPLIGFDDLPSYSEDEFFYLMSRNRSLSANIKPTIRATTNMKPEGWVKNLLAPWLDEAWPVGDRARSGDIRWFTREDGQILWVDASYRGAKSISYVKERYDCSDNSWMFEGE